MNALVDEIRGSFTKLDDLTFENLAELKYMNACKCNQRLTYDISQYVNNFTNHSQ
jgi:hypothetical protein